MFDIEIDVGPLVDKIKIPFKKSNKGTEISGLWQGQAIDVLYKYSIKLTIEYINDDKVNFTGFLSTYAISNNTSFGEDIPIKGYGTLYGEHVRFFYDITNERSHFRGFGVILLHFNSQKEASGYFLARESKNAAIMCGEINLKKLMYS